MKENRVLVCFFFLFFVMFHGLMFGRHRMVKSERGLIDQKAAGPDANEIQNNTNDKQNRFHRKSRSSSCSLFLVFRGVRHF